MSSLDVITNCFSYRILFVIVVCVQFRIKECQGFINNSNDDLMRMMLRNNPIMITKSHPTFLIWNKVILHPKRTTATRAGRIRTNVNFSTVFHNGNNKWSCNPYNNPSSSLLQSKSNCNNEEFKSLEKQLKDIEIQFQKLNHGKNVNLNSPKQVANAIFQNYYSNSSSHDSSSFSTSRTVLETIAQTGTYHHQNDSNPDHTFQLNNMSKQEREMAYLVLQYRDVKSIILRQRKIHIHPTNSPYNPFHHHTTSNPQRSHFSTTTLSNNNQSNNNDSIITNPKPSVIVTESLRNDANGKISSSTPSKQTGIDSNSPNGSIYPSNKRNTSKAETSQIHNYWDDIIAHMSKPAAKSMLQQLNPIICPMGYDPLATPLDSIPTNRATRSGVQSSTTTTTAGKKGSLLSYVRDQKRKYPDSIILTRVGEFYEAFGLDAALLVEFCGLNPMGGKARAGCPIKNIQQTLDCLTNKGFRVAVYEEASDTDSSTGIGATGGAKSRLKTRMLAQIVSPASPTYMYDLVLGSHFGDCLESYSSSSTEARPYVGIISTSAGYTIVEVSSEERTVRTSERVTAEAVACRLAAYPPADPLFYVPSPGEQASDATTNLPFLPSRSDANSDGPGSRVKLKILPPESFMEGHSPGVSDLDRAKKCIVSALLDVSEINEFMNTSEDNTIQNGNSSTKSYLTHDDFLVVSSTDVDTLSSISMEKESKCVAKPLHMETATQLGLMADQTIPSLVKYLLPDSAPAATKRFLRRWLLTPPPPQIADSMAALVS